MKSITYSLNNKFIYLSLLLIIPLLSSSQVKSKLVINHSSKIAETIQLYPIKENGNYGYMNKFGKIIINPQFEDAKDFKDGFAIIKISGKYGFINKSGKISVNPIYEDLQNFSDGLARIKTDGKYGFIGKDGKTVIKPQFDYVESFSNSLAEIKIAGKIGLINNKGEIITNPRFDEISYFSEGLAKVKIDGKYGFVNLEEPAQLLFPLNSILLQTSTMALLKCNSEMNGELWINQASFLKVGLLVN